MGTVYDDLPDHEGYGLCVGADSSDRADARTFAAYQAACECGWRGRVLHPPSDDGYDAAVDEWDRGHARPLLEQAVPRDVRHLVDDAKAALGKLGKERPLAARLALDNLVTWATAAAAGMQRPLHVPSEQPRRRSPRR